jgi:hypothetical protein
MGKPSAKPDEELALRAGLRRAVQAASGQRSLSPYAEAGDDEVEDARELEAQAKARTTRRVKARW